MNSLVTRGSLFDDFFKDIAPGFYVRPLHGDNLPSPGRLWSAPAPPAQLPQRQFNLARLRSCRNLLRSPAPVRC